MTTTSLPAIPVRSADELTQRWRTILTPPVFTGRSLWLSWFDAEGLMSPVVVPIDDLPLSLDLVLLEGLVRLHDTVVESAGCPEGHLAMALCRPGTPHITSEDDEWAEDLNDYLDEVIEGTWSLHLAAGGAVTELVRPPARAWRAG